MTCELCGEPAEVRVTWFIDRVPIGEPAIVCRPCAHELAKPWKPK